MTTTNVFAELLIIGVETLAWFALLIFCLFGYGWVEFSVFNNLAIAIPLAALSYVAGIIMDRVSDALLAGADHKIRRSVMGDSGAQSFAALRIYILAQSPYLSADLDYLRSRLRIMRSSLLNFSLLAIIGAAFVLNRLPITLPTRYTATATVFLSGIVLASLSHYAWRASSITYYLRLQTALALLPVQQENSANAGTVTAS